MKNPKIETTDNRLKWKEQNEFLQEYGYQLKFLHDDDWQRIVEHMNEILESKKQ